MRSLLFRWWWWRMQRAETRLFRHLGQGNEDEGRTLLLEALWRVRHDNEETE